MGKKNNKKSNTVVESDLRPLLQWNAQLDCPFFQIAAHPTDPILYLGLSDGYLYCYKYDTIRLGEYRSSLQSDDDDNGNKLTIPEVTVGDTIPGVQILWKTKRHKSSIRGLAIDTQGQFIFSLGNDNVIKKAKATTGQVMKKVNLPTDWKPSTKMIITDDVVIVGNEVGDVLILDPVTLHLKNRIDKIHFGDAINDIFQFVNRSKYKFISLGQTTLAYWDTHNEDKSKIMVSDDQEDEILCGCFVDNDMDVKGETLVCGMGEGVLTVWKPKRNDLEDQMSRIKICKDESVDCIISTLQDDNCVWCGCSNGKLYKANAKSNKIVEIRVHDLDESDEVTMLDLDHEYRLISGGMDLVRLWPGEEDAPSSDASESDSEAEFSESESSSESVSEGDSDEGSDDSSSNEKEETLVGLSKDELLAELDKDLDSEKEEEEEEMVSKHSNNKRKKNEKKAPLTKKQRKLQQQQKRMSNENHGIAKFDDL